MKQVGVLALQGAFIEHEKMLEQLGVSCIELRNKEDLTDRSRNASPRNLCRTYSSCKRY